MELKRKETPIVSVIIPVYNVECYVERCVQSVCSQTVENIQIILVDDCSEDKSAKRCEELMKKDSRIGFYQQERNKGVSAARNRGILAAKGKYILFVDADDQIDNDMIETLLFIMEDGQQVDLAICGYYIDNRPQLNKCSIRKKMSRLEAAKEIAGFKGSLVKGYAVNKLFKREMILENKVWFDENTFICEDLLFCLQYVSCSQVISYDPIPKYHYITNEGSAMHGRVNVKRMSVLETYSKILKAGHQYEDVILDELLRVSYWNHYVSLLKDIVRTPGRKQIEFGDRIYPNIKHIIKPFLKSKFTTLKRKILISGLLVVYPIWRILPG